MTSWIVADGDGGPLSFVSLLWPVRERRPSLSKGEGHHMLDGILYGIIDVVRSALV
jgi:hypothetical protein